MQYIYNLITTGYLVNFTSGDTAGGDCGDVQVPRAAGCDVVDDRTWNVVEDIKTCVEGVEEGGEEISSCDDTASCGEAVGSGSCGEAVGSVSCGEAVESGSCGEAVGCSEALGSGSCGEAIGSGSCGEAVGSASCGEAVGSGSCSEAVGSGSCGEAVGSGEGVCSEVEESGSLVAENGASDGFNEVDRDGAEEVVVVELDNNSIFIINDAL